MCPTPPLPRVVQVTILHEPPVHETLTEIRTVITHKPNDIFIVLVDFWIGFTLLISNPKREHTPAYVVAREVMPIRAWGLLFIVLGLVALAALACRWAKRYRCFPVLADVSRLGGPALYAFWAATFLIAGVTHSGASFVAVGAYLYLAYRHSFCPVPGSR